MRFWPLKMTRYVLGELLTPTILALFLYTFVVMMNHLFLIAERSMAKNLGWDLTVRLFLVGIPKLLVMTIPMAVLLGVLIAVGRISADNEWVALQGAGQGPGRLLKPIALFGLVATLLSLSIYGVVVPRANYALRSLRGQVLFASNLASDLKPRVFYSTLPNTMLYVSDIRQGDRERLQGVFLVRNDPGEKGLTELFLARSGDLYPDPESPGWLVLDLYDGVDHIYDPEGPDTYRHWAFDSRQLRIDVATYLRSFLDPPEKSVPDFSPRELLQELQTARAAQAALTRSVAAAGGQDAGNQLLLANHRLKVTTMELHQRLALSLAGFFLALLALPLGITQVRSGKGAGFALSILVILVYWIAFTLGRNQASLGNLPAWLGPWTGNLVIFPWSLVSLRRLQRQTGERAGLFARILARIPRRKERSERRRPARGSNSESDTPVSNLSGTPNRFLSRLDQYVSASFLRVLMLTLLSAYLVYALVEFKNLLEDAMRTDQPLKMALFAKYFVYFLPGVLWVVLPISCLVGGIVTFTLLSRTGELTAIKASGLSMRRATLPVLLLTGLFCAVLFLVQDRITPGFNRKAQAVEDEIAGNPPRTYASPAMGQWSFGPDGQTLFHYRHYDPEQDVYERLSIFTLDRETPRIIDHRYARKGRLMGDAWELKRGWYRTLPSDGAPGVYLNYPERHRVEVAAPTNFGTRDVRLAAFGDLPEQLSLEELSQEIKSLEASGYNVTRLKVDYHGKLARSLSPLVMVVLGLPFAFKVGRKGSLHGIGVALILILVYWATFAMFNALGLETVLTPIVAAWAPNILFSLLGAYLMLFIPT